AEAHRLPFRDDYAAAGAERCVGRSMRRRGNPKSVRERQRAGFAMKLCTIALFVCVSVTSAVAGPTTREARVELAKRLWEERLAKAGGERIVSEYYPTEESLVFLTAYLHTRDDRFAQQAAKQLEYAHSRERDGIFVTSEGLTTRDYQARQIYNFYLAYRILAEGRYLRWADDCAAAMTRMIPREAHECAGETHKL